MPSALRQAIESLVEYYNHRRYHEALEYVTPADVYFARRKEAKQRMLQVRKGHSHELALELWQTGVAEARILAAMVDDPDERLQVR